MKKFIIHTCEFVGVHAKSLQLCPTLCNPMDCSLEGSSVHGIFQVRTLDWVAISFFRVFSNPGIKPMSLMSPALAGRSFTPNTTWEAHLLVTRSAFDVRTRSKSRVFIFLFLESNSISLLVKKVSRQESRSSADNNHGADEAGNTQYSRQ